MEKLKKRSEPVVTFASGLLKISGRRGAKSLVCVTKDLNVSLLLVLETPVNENVASHWIMVSSVEL